MKLRVLACVLCLFSSLAAVAQQPAGPPAKDERRTRDQPAAPDELAQITSRGRAIATYDELAWHATDAVQALHPNDADVGMYLGVVTERGLVMGFGHLNAARTKFLLAYESVPGSPPLNPEVVRHEPALEEGGDWLHEALAFEAVKPLVKGEAKSYNLAVIAAPQGRWFVYAYPAQTETGVYPTGSDVRYLVSADGLKIEETHRMHFSLLQWRPPEKGGKTEATYRTAVLDDAPEDTDVAIVLMMGGIPSYVATRKFVYNIDATGEIRYLTTTAVFTKQVK